MIFNSLPLSIILWLMGAIAVGYLPVSLFLYWFTKVRGAQASQSSLIRDRDIAGFFGERPALKWNGWSYIWSLAFATLVIFTGFLLAYPAGVSYLIAASLETNQALAGVASTLEAVSRPLFFGFLGAYLFTLQTTSRRFMTSDLDPDTYVQVATRTILALIVAAIFGLAFPLQITPVAAQGIDSRLLVYVLAFVVGIFPENGLNWIYSFARRFLPIKVDGKEKSYSLRELSGLNSWHAFRLNVEGVENVHNLANADVLELVRRTKFPVQQIFDWVDQAVLLIHLSSLDEFQAMQASSVRGLSDFRAAFLNSETRRALETLLAKQFGLDGSKRLQLLHESLQQAPSGDSIRLFWRYKSSYLTGTFDYYNRAKVFAELGEHEHAIEQCDLALERNPLDPILMIVRGESRRALAQKAQFSGSVREAERLYQLAIADFTNAIELDPFSVDALFNRGSTNLAFEKFAQAEADFVSVLNIAHDNIQALNRRAVAYLAQHRTDESLRDLKRALKLDRKNSETLVNLANTYRKLGDFEKALEAFQEVIQLNPDLPEIYYYRGLLEAAAQPRPRFAAAFQDFNRAIELKHLNPALVFKDWGETLYQQKEFTSAIAAFDLAIEADRSYAQAYNLRGLSYHAAGHPGLAVEDFTYLLENINNEYVDAYVNRGIAFKDSGRYDEALDDLRRGIELDPQLVVAYTNLGDVFRLRKDFPLAVTYYNQAIQLQEKKQLEDPASFRPSPVPYNGLGELKLMQGEYAPAIEYFSRAIDLAPGDEANAGTYSNRGLARRLSGQYSTARDDLNEAIRLDPQSAVYPYNRGLIYLDLGDYEAAIRDFTQAIERQDGNLDAHLSRALAYRSQQELQKAELDVETVLKFEPRHAGALRLRQELAAAGP